MPDKPEWYARIPEAMSQLAAMPHERPVTAHELSLALGIGERRAQQLLKPMATVKCGRSKAAPRLTVASHLKACSQTENGIEAQEEWRRFRRTLARLEEDYKRQPPCLVEAPVSVQRSRLDELAGVHLAPGRIVIEGFQDPEDARRRLLSLAMAIANDQAGFDERVTG